MITTKKNDKLCYEFNIRFENKTYKLKNLRDALIDQFNN